MLHAVHMLQHSKALWWSGPACRACTHLLNDPERNLQHVVVSQHVRDAVTRQQHQPVCRVQVVGADKGLRADQGLRGLKRKVT